MAKEMARDGTRENKTKSGSRDMQTGSGIRAMEATGAACRRRLSASEFAGEEKRTLRVGDNNSPISPLADMMSGYTSPRLQHCYI